MPWVWGVGRSLIVDLRPWHRLDDDDRALPGAAVFFVDPRSAQRVRRIDRFGESIRAGFNECCGLSRDLEAQDLLGASVDLAAERPFPRGDAHPDGGLTPFPQEGVDPAHDELGVCEDVVE